MIRNASHDDIPTMLQMGWEMHAESRYSRHEWDDGKVSALLRNLIDSPDGLALIAERAGKPIGGFIGAAFDHWCTSARQSSDFALFVMPEHRGSLVGIRLLRAYVDWARGRGVSDDLIGCGITTGVDVASSSRLFNIAGFQSVGNLFAFGGELTMCTGMELLALGTMVAGTAVTMYGQDTATKQQESNLKFQAAQAEADARAEAGAAQVEAARIRRASKAQRAQAVAAAAASGIDVDSPTALRIDSDIVRNSEEDAVLTVMGGGDRAARMNQQAHADRNAASAARTAGRINQASTLLAGASTAASQGGAAWKRARAGG